MKKTLQSKLTAALFAAAISTGTGASLSPQSANAADDVVTVPQTTYGPPVWMMTTDESETSTTTATTEMPVFSTEAPTVTMTTSTTEMPVFSTEAPTVTMTTTTEELALAGEPVLYDEPGDVNMNGCIDVHDLSLLKQYLLNQTRYKVTEDVGDINKDGKIDKEDVKALVRMLTGKPEDEAEPQKTTNSSLMTTTTTIGTTTCTLYGPPPAWE